ncbi:MAG: DUF1475 domain-containing protein [Thermoanaerobaculia bacterium]|nr:DUF1475 domain-containing protein [Thermoanaerobaculia bacterium]
MTRNALRLYFAFVFAAMLLLTVLASLQQDLLTAAVALWPDGWFRATLADAYFGFLAFWLWIAYRERAWGARLAWLAGVLLLGNFAMAGYALLALSRLPAGRSVWQVLLRPEHLPPVQPVGSPR